MLSRRGDKPAQVAALRWTQWARLVGLSTFTHGADLVWRGRRQIEGLWMRLPFFDPSRDEIVATATELITRFGLGAHEEASRLAELSAQRRSRRDRVLYEMVGREIDSSFVEAQKRLGLRQSALNAARPSLPQREGHEDGDNPAGDAESEIDRLTPHMPSVSRAADIPTRHVAELNVVDINPSSRHRFGSR
jgi:hypothetical protein